MANTTFIHPDAMLPPTGETVTPIARDFTKTSVAFLAGARHAAESAITTAIRNAMQDYRLATGGEILDVVIETFPHVHIDNSGRRKHSSEIEASVKTSFSRDI